MSIGASSIGLRIHRKGRRKHENPFEGQAFLALLALLVPAAFYGVYLAKVLAQKRRGIQTRQIGRRKEKSIHTVEVLMSIATLGAPIAQILSIAFGWNHLPAGVRLTGFCVGMLGDAIFLLSILCIRSFVEKIEVKKPEKVPGTRTKKQTLVIWWNFIGVVDIPQQEQKETA